MPIKISPGALALFLILAFAIGSILGAAVRGGYHFCVGLGQSRAEHCIRSRAPSLLSNDCVCLVDGEWVKVPRG